MNSEIEKEDFDSSIELHNENLPQKSVEKALKMIEDMKEKSSTSSGSYRDYSSKDYLGEQFGYNNIIEITTVSDYVMEVSNISNEFENRLFSRGVSNYKYDLSPTLFRHFKNSTLVKYDEMFDEFKLSGVYHYDRLANMTDYEISAYAQHYGLPTNLLDFTTGHLISLLFSVEDDDTTDSIVYFVDALSYNSKHANKPYILTNDDVENHERETKPFFSTVPLTNERIHSQKGVFLYFPYRNEKAANPDQRKEIIEELNNNLVDSELIKIILIPGIYKTSILRELINLGIDFEKIYPGIESYIKTLKNRFKEE